MGKRNNIKISSIIIYSSNIIRFSINSARAWHEIGEFCFLNILNGFLNENIKVIERQALAISGKRKENKISSCQKKTLAKIT